MKLDDARAAVASSSPYITSPPPQRKTIRRFPDVARPGILVVLVVTGLFALVFHDWIAYQFASPEQAAEWRATDAMLTHIQMFHVACPGNNMSAADMQRWTAYAQKQGWTPYPSAGAGCVDP